MRNGWIVLGIVVAFAAACGAPPDGNDGTGTPTDPPTGTPTGTGTGTATATPTGSGSGTPTPLPTITNVPSFATWQSTVKPVECSQCHSGGSGGLSFGNQTDNASLHYFWFSALCNFSNVAGVQKYNPPQGKLVTTFCGMNVNHPTSIPSGDCTTVKNWLMTGTATPPDCSANVDYVNSH